MIKYAIGVVYYKKGIAQGVVYVSNTGTTGSVGLNETTGLAWSYDASTFTDTTDGDGLANMTAVKLLDDDFSDYPVFARIDRMNGDPCMTTYTLGAVGLPATDEMRDYDGGLYKVVNNYRPTVFNDIITAAGRSPLQLLTILRW